MAVPDVPGSLRGIDVSAYQTPADWSPDSLSFLIARASIGLDTDSRYAGHIRKARAAGMVTGAYHFGSGSQPIAAQVRTFLEAAGAVDLYALDVEGKDAMGPDQTRQFVRRVQDRGLRIGLYMSEAFFIDAGQDWDWVANWTRKPSRHWDVWQFGPFHQEDGDLCKDAATMARMKGDPTMALLAAVYDPKIMLAPLACQVYDLDGQPVGKLGASLSVATPYSSLIGAMRFRVFATTWEGSSKLLMAETSKVQLAPVPAPDCSAQIAADRAKAKVVVSWD